MIRLAVGFICSLVLTNWALNELAFLAPDVGRSAQKVMQLSLPTHDNWGSIVEGATDSNLHQEIAVVENSLLGAGSIREFLYNLVRPTKRAMKRITGGGSEVEVARKPRGMFDSLFSTFEEADDSIFVPLFASLTPVNAEAQTRRNWVRF